MFCDRTYDTGVMSNADLILLLGLGVLAVGLGLALPPWPNRPTWVTMLLGVIGAVLGGIAFLVIAFR